MSVIAGSPGAAPGDEFVAPYAGPGQAGPHADKITAQRFGVVSVIVAAIGAAMAGGPTIGPQLRCAGLGPDFVHFFLVGR